MHQRREHLHPHPKTHLLPNHHPNPHPKVPRKTDTKRTVTARTRSRVGTRIKRNGHGENGINPKKTNHPKRSDPPNTMRNQNAIGTAIETATEIEIETATDTVTETVIGIEIVIMTATVITDEVVTIPETVTVVVVVDRAADRIPEDTDHHVLDHGADPLLRHDATANANTLRCGTSLRKWLE